MAYLLGKFLFLSFVFFNDMVFLNFYPFMGSYFLGVTHNSSWISILCFQRKMNVTLYPVRTIQPVWMNWMVTHVIVQTSGLVINVQVKFTSANP